MNNQLALAIKLNDQATLSDFNWATNPILQHQLQDVLACKSERIVYLWGTKGCGKSHLLQACCQTSASTTAMYLPLDTLKQWGPESLENLEEQELICIDDIHLIAGMPEWEEALFHLYNKIKDSEQCLLLISGSLPPAQLSIKLPDLRSRLSWGLVFQLNELDNYSKKLFLKNKALKKGFVLPEGVVQFLLNRCSRNMHDLEQLLNHLDEASLAAQRKITIPFVKDILGF